MNAFLRHVLEVRNAEQMAATFIKAQPVTCGSCGKSYIPKAHSHPDKCFTCRHQQERAYKEKLATLEVAPTVRVPSLRAFARSRRRRNQPSADGGHLAGGASAAAHVVAHESD